MIKLSRWLPETLAIDANKLHRQIKIGRNITQRLEPTSVDSKSLVSIPENVMKMTGKRSQMISQLVNQPGDYPHTEFTSYFYGNGRNDEPFYSLTSHGIKCAPKRRSVIPTYPIIGLRWNPYVDTCSIENCAPNIKDQTQYSCRCKDCYSKHCPSRISSSSTLKSSVFKTNIMTFEDKYTMTPKLKDANCGCPSTVSTKRTSQTSIKNSDTTIKGNQTYASFHECPQRYTPILKNHDNFIYKQHRCCAQKEKDHLTDVAERDIDMRNDTGENLKHTSFGSLFKIRKKDENKEVIETKNDLRKVLYNEGISDSIANKCSTPLVRVPVSSRNLDRASQISTCSKLVSQNKINLNNDKLPFAHRNNSKYLHTCKKESSRHLFVAESDDIRHLVASSGRITRRYIRKPINKYQKVSSIKLPKRVLTSERHIEFYIDYSKRKKNIQNGGQEF